MAKLKVKIKFKEYILLKGTRKNKTNTTYIMLIFIIYFISNNTFHYYGIRLNIRTENKKYYQKYVKYRMILLLFTNYCKHKRIKIRIIRKFAEISKYTIQL